MPDGATAQCRVLGRYPFYVNLHDESLTPNLINHGYWESWVSIAVARLVRPGMRCLNVGANVGYYALVLAELTGDGALVTAIEPVLTSYSLMQKTLRVNGHGKAETLRLIASIDNYGHCAIAYYDNNYGGAIVGELKSDSASSVTKEVVPIVKLGTYLGLVSSENKLFDFILVDAEGCDADIIEGCEEIMTSSTVVMFEYSRDMFNYKRDVIDQVLCLKVWNSRPYLYYVDYTGQILPIEKEKVMDEAERDRVWNLVVSTKRIFNASV